VAVILEFCSLIIPIDVIKGYYPGGLRKYKADHRQVFTPENFNVWFDDDLIREGSMGSDFDDMIQFWEKLGVKTNKNDKSWKHPCIVAFTEPEFCKRLVFHDTQMSVSLKPKSDKSTNIRRHKMAFSLNPNDKTFIELQTGKYPWWDNLKKNKDISIQIRKNNRIDVYYNGGAILKDLKFDNTKQGFTANIHPKYIPLKNENHNQSLLLSANGVKFTGSIDPLALSQLGSVELKAVTDRVKKYFGEESEKAIQYTFATNDPYIIDTEFQIEKEPSRIDLIRLDVNATKIVLIEVKTMGDSRLFSSSTDKENIHDQLKKYKELAVKYEKDIPTYYAKVLQIKNALGIGKSELKNLTLTGWQVEPKPLLLFGDCKQ
jgi:hypothetical protein